MKHASRLRDTGIAYAKKPKQERFENVPKEIKEKMAS
jgi:hypothetical protein